MSTDYTPGDPPLPVGTLVDYTGSQSHGRYEIIAHQVPEHHPELRSGGTPSWDLLTAYPDGVAYDIWPVGVAKKFGNRDQAVYWVRRASLQIAPADDQGAQ